MEVMAQTAREHGFTGKFFPELCNPEVGLEFGVTILAHKLAAAEGNASKSLLLWNGGGNPDYPTQVLARAVQYK
jgi:soluble lytic murein transglycosylase-like protein